MIPHSLIGIGIGEMEVTSRCEEEEKEGGGVDGYMLPARRSAPV